MSYGENLIDLTIEQRGDGATLCVYQADNVEVVIAEKVEDSVPTDESSESDEEETKVNFRWHTETVPYHPTLYRVNTSLEWDENSKKWVEDEEPVHAIRYADIMNVHMFTTPSDAGGNSPAARASDDFYASADSILVTLFNNYITNDEDGKPTFINPEESDLPYVLFPDIDWISNRTTVTDGNAMVDSPIITPGVIMKRISFDNPSIYATRPYYDGEKSPHESFSIDDESGMGHNVGDIAYAYGNMYIGDPLGLPNNNPLPIGEIISQDIIRLEGVNDEETFERFFDRLFGAIPEVKSNTL